MGPLTSSSALVSSANEPVEEAVSFEDLAPEILIKIFSNFDLATWSKARLVSKKWKEFSDDGEVTKKVIFNNFAFGNREWERFFDYNVEESAQEEYDSLPNDIDAILRAPCPAFAGKQVGATHVLVRIPKGLTLEKMGKMAKEKYFPKAAWGGYSIVWKEGRDRFQDQTYLASRWVLMTRNLIPRSLGVSFETQNLEVKNLQSVNQQFAYRIPKMLEVVACCYANYAASGEKKVCLLGGASFYTRTEERIANCRLIVGGFTANGIGFIANEHNQDTVGVVALRVL